MNAWSSHDLDAVARAEELELASYRRDGTLRPYVTMWVVRAEEDLYVRSAHGPDNGWYRRAIEAGTGRIRAGGVETDVEFDRADPDVHDAIDDAYHAKYDRYGPRIVDTVVGPATVDVTIRLVPHRPQHR